MENKLYLRVIAALKRLPEMQKTLRRLARELDRIKTAGK
jgi:hypothetical protein